MVSFKWDWGLFLYHKRVRGWVGHSGWVAWIFEVIQGLIVLLYFSFSITQGVRCVCGIKLEASKIGSHNIGWGENRENK